MLLWRSVDTTSADGLSVGTCRAQELFWCYSVGEPAKSDRLCLGGGGHPAAPLQREATSVRKLSVICGATQQRLFSLPWSCTSGVAAICPQTQGVEGGHGGEALLPLPFSSAGPAPPARETVFPFLVKRVRMSLEGISEGWGESTLMVAFL